MKLVAAQIASFRGNIEQNIAKHMSIIERAASFGADAIFFPELSLTAYEPELADGLAIQIDDPRLDEFQHLTDRFGILIAVGAPLRVTKGVEIAMVVFQARTERLAYSKQLLHGDELPFFSAGNAQKVLLRASEVLVPAICYESLQAIHAQKAADAGATIYFTSVAKSLRGVAAAYSHYPQIARQYTMSVVMANCVGPADNFIGAGRSGIWNAEGELVAKADEFDEALVAYDSVTGEGNVLSI